MELIKVDGVGVTVMLEARDCALLAQCCDAAQDAYSMIDQAEALARIQAYKTVFELLGIAGLTVGHMLQDQAKAWHGELERNGLGELVHLGYLGKQREEKGE